MAYQPDEEQGAPAGGGSFVDWANQTAGQAPQSPGGGAPERAAPPQAGGGSFVDWANQTAGQASQSPDQNKGIMGDFGTDLKRGALKLPGMVAGLLDIPVGLATNQNYVSRAADAIGKATGFTPGQWAEDARSEYSADRQRVNDQTNQSWDTALEDGFQMRDIGTIARPYLENPAHAIGGLVMESLPSMGAGGVLGKGVMMGGNALKQAAPTLSKFLTKNAPYLGEGLVGAGMTMDALGDVEGMDHRHAALASLGAGVTTTAFGRAGGELANSAGVGDLQQAMTPGYRQMLIDQGRHIAEPIASRPSRMAVGGGIEGLQEIGQGGTEQMWHNVGTGEDLGKGVLRAGVEGALAGTAMGTAFNAIGGPKRNPNGELDPTGDADIYIGPEPPEGLADQPGYNGESDFVGGLGGETSALGRAQREAELQQAFANDFFGRYGEKSGIFSREKNRELLKGETDPFALEQGFTYEGFQAWKRSAKAKPPGQAGQSTKAQQNQDVTDALDWARQHAPDMVEKLAPGGKTAGWVGKTLQKIKDGTIDRNKKDGNPRADNVQALFDWWESKQSKSATDQALAEGFGDGEASAWTDAMAAAARGQGPDTQAPSTATGAGSDLTLPLPPGATPEEANAILAARAAGQQGQGTPQPDFELTMQDQQDAPAEITPPEEQQPLGPIDRQGKLDLRQPQPDFELTPPDGQQRPQLDLEPGFGDQGATNTDQLELDLEGGIPDGQGTLDLPTPPANPAPTAESQPGGDQNAASSAEANTPAQQAAALEARAQAYTDAGGIPPAHLTNRIDHIKKTGAVEPADVARAHDIAEEVLRDPALPETARTQGRQGIYTTKGQLNATWKSRLADIDAMLDAGATPDQLNDILQTNTTLNPEELAKTKATVDAAVRARAAAQPDGLATDQGAVADQGAPPRVAPIENPTTPAEIDDAVTYHGEDYIRTVMADKLRRSLPTRLGSANRSKVFDAERFAREKQRDKEFDQLAAVLLEVYRRKKQLGEHAGGKILSDDDLVYDFVETTDSGVVVTETGPDGKQRPKSIINTKGKNDAVSHETIRKWINEIDTAMAERGIDLSLAVPQALGVSGDGHQVGPVARTEDEGSVYAEMYEGNEGSRKDSDVGPDIDPELAELGYGSTMSFEDAEASGANAAGASSGEGKYTSRYAVDAWARAQGASAAADQAVAQENARREAAGEPLLNDKEAARLHHKTYEPLHKEAQAAFKTLSPTARATWNDTVASLSSKTRDADLAKIATALLGVKEVTLGRGGKSNVDSDSRLSPADRKARAQQVQHERDQGQRVAQAKRYWDAARAKHRALPKFEVLPSKQQMELAELVDQAGASKDAHARLLETTNRIYQGELNDGRRTESDRDNRAGEPVTRSEGDRNAAHAGGSEASGSVGESSGRDGEGGLGYDFDSEGNPIAHRTKPAAAAVVQLTPAQRRKQRAAERAAQGAAPKRSYDGSLGRGTTAQAVNDTINRALGGQSRTRLHVYQSVEDAEAAGISRKDAENAKAWVQRGKDGRWHAFFIADNIKPGRELGVFLHEVGSHLGIDGALDQDVQSQLALQIKRWAIQNDGSIEHQIAKKALARVKAAQRAGDAKDSGTAISERIAYFIEEAANAGVMPEALANPSSRLGQFFQMIFDALRKVIQKSGLGIENITAQDMVDMALGMANYAIKTDNVNVPDRQAASYSRVSEQARRAAGRPDPSRDHVFGRRLVDHISAARTTAVDKIMFHWMSMEQLADQFGQRIPEIKTISSLFNRMEASSLKTLSQVQEIDRHWADLTDAENQALSLVQRTATRLEFDPDPKSEGYRLPKNAEERAVQKQWNKLAALSTQRIQSKKGKAKARQWTAQEIYRKVRDHYRHDLDEAIKHIERLSEEGKVDGDDGVIAAREQGLIQIITSLKKRRNMPYFPLRRLGEWYTVAMSQPYAQLKQLQEDGQLNDAQAKQMRKMEKQEAHFAVSGYDSQAQALRAERELKQSGYHFVYHNETKKHLRTDPNSVMPKLEEFENMLQRTGIDSGALKTLKENYESLLIASSPDNSMLRRLIERKGVHGEETNMRRVFADTGQSRAFALSRLVYSRDIDEALSKLNEKTSPKVGDQSGEHQLATALYNTMRKRQELAFDPQEVHPVARVMSQMSYVSLLGASPAFWLLNLSQVPLVTLPWLSARNSNKIGGTFKSLTKNAVQMGQLIQWTYHNGEMNADVDWAKAAETLTPGQLEMLQYLRDQGQLDFTIGYDLAAIAQGKNDKLDRIIRSINSPTTATEIINRGATALTAYQIKLEQTGDQQLAMDFAREAASTTQVNYSPVNVPPALQRLLGSKSLAAVAFQFWRYQQGMAYLALSTLRNMHAADEQTAKEARATAIGLTATTMLSAGAFGLPFMSTLTGGATLVANALLAVGGDDDREFDVERELKNIIHDIAPDLAPYFTNGVMNEITGLDIGSRTGMGGLLNPFAYSRMSPGDSGRDTASEAMFSMAGAPVANTVNMLEALKLAADGDFDGAWTKGFPLKGARDLVKGWNLDADGFERGDGTPLVPDESFTAWEKLGQYAGFAPAVKGQYYQANDAIQRRKKVVDTARGDLLNDYARAYRKRDGKAVNEVLERVMRFNQRNPHVPVTMDILMKSIKRRQEQQYQRNEIGVLADRNTAPYQELARFAR